MDNNFSDLSVFDMIAEAEENIPDGSLFDTTIKEEKKEEKKSEKKEWTPSADALEEAGMNNKPAGVIYKKEDVILKDNEGFKNLVEDGVKQESQDQMDELDRIAYNIERAKKKLGIVKLAIDHNHLLSASHRTELINLANDKDSFDRLVIRLDQITQEHPEYVLERVDDKKNEDKENNNIDENKENVDIQDVVINIDKDNVDKIIFDQEYIDKVKSARNVVLNVKEEKDLSFTIVDSDENIEIDNILSEYDRKIGDFPLTLPASHYRCIVTGLSYPEIIDLSYSHEVTNFDTEKKKWSIAFKHVTNPSIGKFHGWIDENDVEHTAFEDFMRKTSNHDLQLILWGIICATTFDEESTFINCNIPDCKSSYEWIYHPKELIDMDSVPNEILEEMRMVGEAQGEDNILQIYNESCLNKKRMIKLSDSGIIAALSHSSADRYLNQVFPKILSLRDDENSDLTDAFAASVLEMVDHLLIPKKGTNGYMKVTKIDNIIELLKSLSSVDCKILATLLEDIATPYHFTFTMKDVKCPKCGNISNIQIQDMHSMLFMITRSLENVNVELRRS